jgi:hypothetical protein
MFRVKVALIAAVVVAVVTGVVFVQVTGRLDESVTKHVEAMVKDAQQMVARSSRLESTDLTSLTAGVAHDAEIVGVVSETNEDKRRQAATVACDGYFARLEKDKHKPGIIGIVDAKGHLIARDHSNNWRYGDDLTKDFPSLGAALAGPPKKDVWDMDGVMYRVAASSVKSPTGSVLGAVFIGYVQSGGDATEESERAGVEVAYFFESKGKMKIGASSFKRGEGGSSESTEEKVLAEQLFQAQQPDGTVGLAAPATGKHEATPLFRVKLSGDEWVGAAAPLLGNIETSTTKSGFVVLTSLSAAKAPVSPIGMMVLVVGLVGLLAAVGAAVMTARRFLNPLDKVEGGVTEVINGNRDYVFESPSQDFEGLANGLNVMLARLLGRPEPGEEEEEGASEGSGQSNRWQGDGIFVDEAAAAAGGAQAATAEEAAQLAAEPENAYYQRIWREYHAARQQTGEGVEGLDGEQFLSKLRQNEAVLCKKYNARMVRFKVVVKGNQTTLKPVPIA